MEARTEKDQIKYDLPLILDISCFYHDSSAALLKGTEILAAAQEMKV